MGGSGVGNRYRGITVGRVVDTSSTSKTTIKIERTQSVQLNVKTVEGLKSFKNYYGGHKEMVTYDDIIDLLIISYKQTHEIHFEPRQSSS